VLGNKTRFVLPLLITVIFLFRILVFAGSYGSVEHDSGWYLGVAKNLAIRGIYASYTNSVVSPGVGAFPSIFHRYSVQDANGFIYFPAAVTVGPGYVVPEAIVIKFFGSGWWQYRAWPLLGFTLMLFLSLYTVWRLGGVSALVFFAGWLWIIPQFTTQFAYEAYSEDIAFLFLLSGFYFLFLSLKTKHQILFALLGGICLSFSYLTKELFLLPIMGFVAFAIWDLYKYRFNKQYLLRKWLIFFAGAFIPVIIFNTYEYTYVLSHFGSKGWQAVQEDNKLVFMQGGSGFGSIDAIAQSLFILPGKVTIWEDIGSNIPIIMWIAFLLSPFAFLLSLKPREKVFCTSLYLAAVFSFLWYILLSTDGWARHIWQGLIIGMMLISISLGILNKHSTAQKKKILWITVGILCLISANYRVLSYSPILPPSTITYWKSIDKIRGQDGFPCCEILSFQDQKQVISFFSQRIKPNDRIYFLGGYLVADISPLVDKVFYPLQRYINLDGKNPDGGNSYVIVGPYQQGLWSLEPPDYVPEVKKTICKTIIFQNPSYLVCTIKPLQKK
jgi:hypothetical protein